MDTAIKFAELPWTTIMVLASGYAGYFIAHIGARSHHKTPDITFGTLVFGFWGLFAYLVAMVYLGVGSLIASLAAMLVAMVLGGIWSAVGRKWFDMILRWAKITQSDDLPYAWDALGRELGADTTQLTVKTVDGVTYHCEDLHRFKDAPNGPCVFGSGGDMLFYPTHYQGAIDTDLSVIDGVSSDGWGDEITYLPRERIARVDIRRIKRK